MASTKSLLRKFTGLRDLTAKRLKVARAARQRALTARAEYLLTRSGKSRRSYRSARRHAAVRLQIFRSSHKDREAAKAAYLAARTRTPREKFMLWCYAQVGTTELTGHNDGAPVLRWQRHTARGARYLDGAPYCGIGLENGAAAIGCETTPQWASVAAIEALAKQGRGGFSRWTTNRHSIKPDEIVLVVLFGQGVHVEGVDKFNARSVDTVGFNTSPGTVGSQSNGGGVYRRRGSTARPYSQVHGYAVVKSPKE